MAPEHGDRQRLGRRLWGHAGQRNASHLTISDSILAGRRGSASTDQNLTVTDGSARLSGGVILGAAAMVTGGRLNTSGTVLVLADGPGTLADMFAGIDPDGTPTPAVNGGPERTVALQAGAANRALASGDPALLPLDVHDVDGESDVAETLPLAANGVAIRSAAPDLRAAALLPGPDAVDDAYALLRSEVAFSGNVLADAGLVPDLGFGLDLHVAAVDGVAGLVGSSFGLAGGGRLQVNADGAFSFARDGDFADLAIAASRTVSFTCTLADALGLTGQAQVRLTVAGVNAPPAASATRSWPMRTRSSRARCWRPMAARRTAILCM